MIFMYRKTGDLYEVYADGSFHCFDQGAYMEIEYTGLWNPDIHLEEDDSNLTDISAGEDWDFIGML